MHRLEFLLAICLLLTALRITRERSTSRIVVAWCLFLAAVMLMQLANVDAPPRSDTGLPRSLENISIISLVGAMLFMMWTGFIFFGSARIQANLARPEMVWLPFVFVGTPLSVLLAVDLVGAGWTPIDVLYGMGLLIKPIVMWPVDVLRSLGLIA